MRLRPNNFHGQAPGGPDSSFALIVFPTSALRILGDAYVEGTIGTAKNVAVVHSLSFAGALDKLRTPKPSSNLVEPVGFEPTASSMPWRRAANCATAPPEVSGRVFIASRHVAVKPPRILEQRQPRKYLSHASARAMYFLTNLLDIQPGVVARMYRAHPRKNRRALFGR
jgi:hypothetical protein